MVQESRPLHDSDPSEEQRGDCRRIVRTGYLFLNWLSVMGTDPSNGLEVEHRNAFRPLADCRRWNGLRHKVNGVKPLTRVVPTNA